MPPTSNFGQDITNTANNDNNNNNDGNGNNALANIERMGGRLMLPRLAGKGVIKVVRRCEDAKENNKLGKINKILNRYLIDSLDFFSRSNRVSILNIKRDSAYLTARLVLFLSEIRINSEFVESRLLSGL